MKKTPAPLVKSYMPLILWRDSLDEIVRILTVNCESVELKSGEYTFESVAEMANHFGSYRPILALDINAHGPHVSLDLNRLWARLYVGPSDKAGAIFFELDRILSEAQRWHPVLYS